MRRWQAALCATGFGSLLGLPALAAGTATGSDAQYSLALGIFCFVAVGALALWLGVRTDILRDSQPVDFGGARPARGSYRRPYSLAQCQMTWWFCIIFASYVYIAFATHTINGILNEQSLVLMGIGIGTGLGAAMIEQTKSDGYPTLNQFNAVLTQIGAQPSGGPIPRDLLDKRDQLAKQLASENLVTDILTDIDGISLHRFQSVVWTTALGGIYVASVLAKPALPAFDNYLLAVLGISGGTYLGFKVPEVPA